MLRPACMRRVSSELTHALSGLHAPYEPPTCVRKNLRSTDCDHLLNVLVRLPSSLFLAVNCKAALARACTSVVAALFAPLSVHGHSYHHCHDHLRQNSCGQCIRSRHVSSLPDGIPMSAATLDKFGVASFVKLVRVTVSMHRTMQQGSRLFPLKGARVVKKGTYGDLLL